MKAALAGIAAAFPGAAIALGAASREAIDKGNQDFERRQVRARCAWACDDPRTVESWDVGWRLLESRTLAGVTGPARTLLPRSLRATLAVVGALFPRQMRVYQLNLFKARPPL